MDLIRITIASLVFSLVTSLGLGDLAGNKIDTSEAISSADGVTLILPEIQTAKNDLGSTVFAGVALIMNDSDEPVMQVDYDITALGADGEELYTFSRTFNQEDTAIAPHSAVVDVLPQYRHYFDREIANISVLITNVIPESQMPAIHLPHTGDYLYQTLEDARLANILTVLPQKITVVIDQGGYRRIATIEDPEEIAEAARLFCTISIAQETDEWVTDNYNYIVFTWDDEHSTFISLNLMNLEYQTDITWHMYKLNNLGGFWSYAESRAVDE